MEWRPQFYPVPVEPMVARDAVIAYLAEGRPVLRCQARDYAPVGAEVFVAQEAMTGPVIFRYFWVWIDSDAVMHVDERSLSEGPTLDLWPIDIVQAGTSGL